MHEFYFFSYLTSTGLADNQLRILDRAAVHAAMGACIDWPDVRRTVRTVEGSTVIEILWYVEEADDQK